MMRFATALLALALFAGSAFAEPITIEFWHAMGGKNGEMTQSVCDKFNASQTDYKVVPVFKNDYTSCMTGAIAAFRAGTPPAIAQIFEVGTATFMAAKGAYKPVYQLMAENGEKFDPSIYIPAIRGYYSTVDGKMLSMPFNSSTGVVYYNKDAFKKAGLDPEKSPKTWADMYDMSKKLMAAGYKNGFTSSWATWIQTEQFLAWHNVPYGTKANGFGGLDSTLQLNNPLLIRHFTDLYNWSKEKVFVYGGREGKPDALFTSGEVPIYFQSIGSYANMKSASKFEVGVGNLPYYGDVKTAPQNSIIGGASLWVMGKKSPAEYKGVARFFTFISRPEIQAFWHQGTGYLPITKAAYELTKLQGFYNDRPGLELAILQLNNKPTTDFSRGVRFGNLPQIRILEDETWEAILDDKISVKDGFDKVVKEGNALLRDFERVNK